MARIAGAMEEIHQPIYDSYNIATGAVGTLSLFTVPIGQAGSGYATPKTLLETNLKQSGQIAAPGSFEVRGFSISARAGATFADMYVLADQLAFRFTVDAKSMFEIAPVGKLGGGYGVVSWQTTAAGTVGGSIGWPDARSLYTLASPFTIDVGQTFSVDLVIPVAITLSATTRLYAYIEGVYRRSVQ